LEVTERKLLPIPEDKNYISRTMIQDYIKTIKAEYRELKNTEILQVIQNRIFQLKGYFELKVYQRAAVIGITNNLFVIYPNKLVEQLLLQLNRNILQEIVLNLRALKALLEERYFDPEVIPEQDTYTARIRLVYTITQDLLDKQEPETEETTDTDSTSSTSSDNSDWGLLAELSIPPKGYTDYIL
jgi:hypothetical protein